MDKNSGARPYTDAERYKKGLKRFNEDIGKVIKILPNNAQQATDFFRYSSSNGISKFVKLMKTAFSGPATKSLLFRESKSKDYADSVLKEMQAFERMCEGIKRQATPGKFKRFKRFVKGVFGKDEVAKKPFLGSNENEKLLTSYKNQIISTLNSLVAKIDSIKIFSGQYKELNDKEKVHTPLFAFKVVQDELAKLQKSLTNTIEFVEKLGPDELLA